MLSFSVICDMDLLIEITLLNANRLRGEISVVLIQDKANFNKPNLSTLTMKNKLLPPFLISAGQLHPGSIWPCKDRNERQLQSFHKVPLSAVL